MSDALAHDPCAAEDVYLPPLPPQDQPFSADSSIPPVHVRELGMQAASDQEIFDHGAKDDRIVVSADTDFGTLLAIRKQNSPSVILFRHGSQHRPADQAALLKTNLPQIAAALDAGSIVVIQPDRIRIRALPLIP